MKRGRFVDQNLMAVQNNIGEIEDFRIRNIFEKQKLNHVGLVIDKGGQGKHLFQADQYTIYTNGRQMIFGIYIILVVIYI